MKKWKNGFILLLICILYGLISLYGAYVALSKAKTGHERFNHSRISGTTKGPKLNINLINTKTQLMHFDIWDTCGLGVYLWKNILLGEITRYNLNNGWIQSSLEIDGFYIRYNLGYGLTPDQALIPSQPNLVLIVNSRAPELESTARQWLDHALKSAYIDRIALMILGSETCENNWIQPYLQHGRIKCVFIVYDSPLVDDDFIHQWPLGVASYRNFLNMDNGFLDLTARRPYLFNFIGTVYKKSSRVQMMDTVKHLRNSTKEYIKVRDEWVAEEDPESMANYQHILLSSDLTLSPIGRNSECYRMYEAMELGSIPIIEDVLSEGSCDYKTTNQTSAPYRLLKKYKGPMIYVKNWKSLPSIIEKFDKMPHELKVRSRINLIRWYVDFKAKMKEKFLGVIRDKMFYV